MGIIFGPAVIFFVIALVLPWGRPLKWGAAIAGSILLLLIGWGVGTMAFGEPPTHHGDALGMALSIGFFMLWTLAFASGLALRFVARLFVWRRTKRSSNAANEF